MPSLNILKTTPTNSDFKSLIALLDKDLAITDGEEHDFYHQFNGTQQIKHVLVGYIGNTPVSCGAFKVLHTKEVEIKRMYTDAHYRGKGYAAQLLSALEKWAAAEGFTSCVLETGTRQKAAIALYHKCGYQIISNYGPYKGVKNSLCFKKAL
ncbi:MAG: GNAT family N-acetyltransferase [Flavobacteriaceae bacterium]|nr:GNAT family N-acetyltransferase [Flavobacteriaceae bacterium]MDG2416071.1 GNAT family N-acetyltransferase [Flavobacteriaceae bacterium]